MRFFIEPFLPEDLSIYWPILVEGALVAVSLGLIGCFLVVRGLSLLGDALSHSVLPGIVVGFLIGGSLHSPWILIGATAFGMAAAVLVQTVHSQSRVKEDASLGIIFTTLFAAGVVMINLYAGQADLDPGCVLYGNLEHFVIKSDGIWPMTIILCGIVAALLIFYRQLLVSTFDPGLAVSLGIPATLIHYIVMAALSLTIVTSFEAVGAILAVALLIMPGATARLWTDRMPRMLMLAAAHGIASTAIGYWLSHEAVMNTSAAGAICVAGFGLFIASWLGSPRHGLITRLISRRRLAQNMAVENLLKAIEEIGKARNEERVAITDVAAELRLTPKLFTTTLDRAASRNFIEKTDGNLRLTPQGRNLSQRLTRAHELWEQFLQQQVGLPPDHVHDAAEWIEHHLNEEEIQKLDEVVSKPAGG